MSAPVLDTVAAELYERLAPFAFADEENDYALAHLCAAWASGLQEIDDLVRDTDDGVGWSGLFDVDRCPEQHLPYLAQINGTRLPPGLSEQEKRDWIKDAAGQKRGTVGAIKAAAQPYLTGTKTVFLEERQGGAYKLSVATFVSETTDADAVERAIRAQKPAGIVLTYSTIVGGDWETLLSTHADWDDVEATFTDWLDVRNDPSQT